MAKNRSSKLNELLENGKSRSLFATAVTALFVVILAVVGIVPAYSSIGLQVEENKERDIAIQKLQKKLSDLQALTKESQDKKTLLDFFNSIFPKQLDQQALNSAIVTLSEKNGVYVSSLTFSRDVDLTNFALQSGIGENVKAVNIILVMEGAKDSLVKFANDIEVSRLLMHVSNLSLTRKSDVEVASSANGLDYFSTMQLYFFYFDSNLET